MASKWVVEKNFPEEDTWQPHENAAGEPLEYPSKAQAQAVCDVLAEVYHRMNWRAVEQS